MKCFDCKDRFYYPLIGPREPCQTCAETEELHRIYVPGDSGLFFHREQSLGKILKINVLSYHPLATRFDGNTVIEYTDTKSKEFQEITSNRKSYTWWGTQYIVEHTEIGKAKFNYKPIRFLYHFHGSCEVTLHKLIIDNKSPITVYRKVMKQL